MTELYPRVQSPAPLRTQVYEALEELILDGRLKAGERLVESDLASKLGVSRGPIREALQHLERDGWLEVRPRQGTYVRIPEHQELRDYFWVRTLLEVEVATRAAARVRRDPTGSKRDVARLRELQRTVEELSERLPSPEDDEAAELDLRRRYRDSSRQFHYTLGRLSGSQALEDLLEYLGKRTRWYFSSLPHESRVGEHAEILEAVVAGDDTRAAALMTAHMEGMSTMSDLVGGATESEGSSAGGPRTD